jgi:phage terminase large subunit-like protein
MSTLEKPFKLTPKQTIANLLLAGIAMYIMLFGGSRSGKTFTLVRAVCVRALKSSGSRHAIVRYRFNAVKNSIVFDTFPKVMALCFPGVQFVLDKSNWYVRFENGSEIWFAGLDDKERTEKILGMEFITIYFNECSQIPWSSVETAITRLAQKCLQQAIGDRPESELKPRLYFDCNPPPKSHWTYKLFVEKRHPDTKEAHRHPENYACMQINPADNEDNIVDGYLDTLRAMSARARKRFLDGEFADANPNALFPEEYIDRYRVTDGILPDMVRVVVSCDPSGADDDDNADNDAIGIVVAGLGTDGNAYIGPDLTVKAGPATWGKVTTDAYDNHQADAVVGETNFGGAMVEYVIKTCRPRTNFVKVTASRGKTQRAEPFSALYEQGKVRHVGYLNELEDEMGGFSTHGYIGGKSPNRADAAFWALAALFPAIVAPKDKTAMPKGFVAALPINKPFAKRR